MPIGASKISNFGLPDAIPDSEANQKLLHRWYLGRTEPFVDQIGTEDATNHGTAELTGEWVDGAARDGDGVDDYVETTTWGDFGSQMGTGFAIAWSTSTTDDEVNFFGTRTNSADRIEANIGGFDVPSNKLGFVLEDADGNDTIVSSGSDVNDGGQKRIVWNAPDPDPNTWELYINQSEDALTVERDALPSSFDDFGQFVALFARNLDGTIDNHIDGVIDDFCVFGDDLTTEEAQSYQNPWQ